MTIGCAVLAAGASTRLGRPKQLLLAGGASLVRRTVDAACGSLCGEVAVIVGAHADEVASEINGRAVVLRNDVWREGIGSSIRRAASWAIARGHRAIVLTVCDQPCLTADHLDALVLAHVTGGGHRVVASAYASTRGVPAIFPASWFDRLAALEGASGAAPLLRAYPDIDRLSWPDGALDIDTEADVARLAELTDKAS